MTLKDDTVYSVFSVFCFSVYLWHKMVAKGWVAEMRAVLGSCQIDNQHQRSIFLINVKQPFKPTVPNQQFLLHEEARANQIHFKNLHIQTCRLSLWPRNTFDSVSGCAPGSYLPFMPLCDREDRQMDGQMDGQTGSGAPATPQWHKRWVVKAQG